MKNLLLNFWQDEDGATAIEYGLIAGLIAVAIIVAVGGIGDHLKRFFEFISTELDKVSTT